MKRVIRDLKHYIQNTLHINVECKPWKTAEQLPFLIRDLYEIYEGNILDTPCLFLVARSEKYASPSKVKKHIELVRKNWDGICILVYASMPSYLRQRLMQIPISFIVPGNQLYLKDLGMDLREQFLSPKKSKQEFLTPATQAFIIHLLLKGGKGEFYLSESATALNYSKMTLTRVFNELEEHYLGEISRVGKERKIAFSEEREALWKRVKNLMRTPIAKRVLLKFAKNQDFLTEKGLVCSGLSALSQSTMINPPDLPVYALAKNQWDSLSKSAEIEQVPFRDEADLELELWNYDPTLLETNQSVDPYSLYLSLRETEDERIQKELEHLI
jgi:DNA-binding MarR family transcriptional regulator